MMATDELETGAVCVEVRVVWDDIVLHVAHLTPPRSLYVGEESGCDYVVPSEILGAPRAALVLVVRGSVSVGRVPGATSIELDGESISLVGDTPISLPRGSSARMFFARGLTVEVSTVLAGRAVRGRSWFEARLAAAILLSALIHAAVLAAMVFFTPAPWRGEAVEVPLETQHRLQKVMHAVSQRDAYKSRLDALYTRERRPTFWRSRYDEPVDRVTQHREDLHNGMDFHVIRLLQNHDPNGPTDAHGNLLRNEEDLRWLYPIEDFLTATGLAVPEPFGMVLRPPGATLAVRRSLAGQGFGGSSQLRGTHRAKPPSVRAGAVSVHGRLDPEMIKRIVRSRHRHYRACYEEGLRRNPNLAGTVSVSFVIGAGGEVGSIGGGGNLPDGGVVRCITKNFYGLSFPAPERGIVKVVYPIQCSPGG